MQLWFLTAAFLALGLPSLCQPSGTPVDPIVDLGYAKYRGRTNTTDGYDRFYGIRYAAAPVGSTLTATPPAYLLTDTGQLRWRAPQSPQKLSGVVDVREKLATVCPQGSYNGLGADFETQIGYNISEDCLTANVYRPTGATKRSGLPVVVYIHGGGYSLGDHNSEDPQAWLSLASRDVVAVVINYRLGIFGFLAGEEVKRNGVLNAGLLDQQFALQWVQKYVNIFGGDPNQVTIWGQSAGAGSVLHHVLANNGRTTPPLFKRAVANSPFFPHQYTYNHPIPTNLFKQLTSTVGCSTSKSPLDCLRSKPLIPDLRDANIRIGEQSVYGVLTWVPVLDGVFVTSSPSSALTPGSPLNGEKVLTTHNAWEGISFAPPTLTAANLTAHIAALNPTVSPKLIQTILEYYPQSRYDSPLQRAQAIIQDPLFVCPSMWLADAFPAGKGWKGVWAVAPASHGQDAGYYFNDDPKRLPSYSTFENWVGAIVGMIREGEPDAVRYNRGVNPEWAPWRGRGGSAVQKVFYVDGRMVSRPVVGRVDGGVLERCLFWRGIGGLIGL